MNANESLSGARNCREPGTSMPSARRVSLLPAKRRISKMNWLAQNSRSEQVSNILRSLVRSLENFTQRDCQLTASKSIVGTRPPQSRKNERRPILRNCTFEPEMRPTQHPVSAQMRQNRTFEPETSPAAQDQTPSETSKLHVRTRDTPSNPKIRARKNLKIERSNPSAPLLRKIKRPPKLRNCTFEPERPSAQATPPNIVEELVCEIRCIIDGLP